MTYQVECAKCGGRGEIKAFSNIAGGICFCCNGKGTTELKNKPQRASSFAVSAVCKETNERIKAICFIKAKTESQALKMAVMQLGRGNAYIAETAGVRPA